MSKEPVNMDGIDVEWFNNEVGRFLQKVNWNRDEVEWAIRWMIKHADGGPRTRAQAEVILTMCRLTHPPKGEP